jgi:hypothetical protein
MTVPLVSAVTPKRLTPLGELTKFQLEPFHCSRKLPTTQMLLAETAAISGENAPKERLSALANIKGWRLQSCGISPPSYNRRCVDHKPQRKSYGTVTLARCQALKRPGQTSSARSIFSLLPERRGKTAPPTKEMNFRVRLFYGFKN